MDVTAVVLYRGVLATYEVSVNPDGPWRATLSNYKGSPSAPPPHVMEIQREGRHWVSRDGDQVLADEIGYAVESKIKPLLGDRQRDTFHPAEVKGN